MLKPFCYLQIAWMNLRDREEGQTMAEYALVLALIAAVTALVFTNLGKAVALKLKEITGIVDGSAPAAPAA